MGYSKHELGTINMSYSLKKKFILHSLPPANCHLFTTATFFCPQGGPLWRGTTVLSKLDMTQYIKYLKPVYKERGLSLY